MHPENTGWIDAVIVSYHASKTYMSAKEIKGQLSLIVGKDFFDKYEDSKKYFEEASKILGFDMEKMCFEENEDLNNTQYTQAAMFTAFYGSEVPVTDGKIYFPIACHTS